jgi:6-phosphogluconate dehydrogenase
MKLGYIGLGKMGYGMVLKMLEKGHGVVAFNRSPEKVNSIKNEGAIPAYTISEIFENLSEGFSENSGGRKLIWLMVPHQTVDEILEQVLPNLKAGDIVIDGGNSPFEKSIERGKKLADLGFDFLDIGTSGGPGGARNGACLMIGGKQEIFSELENLFKDISVENGYGYMGPVGAGHFVKMIHNGIEYGMMQAIGEGFGVLKSANKIFGQDLDLQKVTEVYNHGSVIESRLIGWLEKAYTQNSPELNGISGEVKHSGEGLWTVETAEKLGVPVENIKQSLDFRIKSENNPSYTGKVVSALRNQFGGHDVAEGGK